MKHFLDIKSLIDSDYYNNNNRLHWHVEHLEYDKFTNDLYTWLNSIELFAEEKEIFDISSVFIYTEAGLINDIVVTWKIFILAFMLNLIREIIKDIQDIDGDNSNNITTLPILIGVYPTIIFLRGLSFIFILVSMHPSYTYQYSIYYIPLILFSIHIPLLYIMWGLRVDITTKKLNHFSNFLKIMIINGIIIILLSH